MSSRPSTAPRRSARAIVPATTAMVLVGSAVVASAPLATVPLFAAQALRYGLAAVLLLALAPLFRQALRRPRGVEWLWVALGAGTGLVAYNAALVVGTRHADPSALGTAVAGVPILLALLGPLTGRRSVTVARRWSGRVVAGAVIVATGAALVAGGGRADALGAGCALVMVTVDRACEGARRRRESVSRRFCETRSRRDGLHVVRSAGGGPARRLDVLDRDDADRRGGLRAGRPDR